MAPSTKSNRRRQLLINPKLQWTIILFNIGLATLALIVIYFQNQFIFQHLMESQQPEMTQDPFMRGIIEADMARMKAAFLVTGGVIFSLMFIGGLILSNRIAGPIYHLEKHLKGILDGKPTTEVKFRDRDFFQSTADLVNQVLKKKS